MLFYIQESGDTYELSMRTFLGNGYSQDFFDDLEAYISRLCLRLPGKQIYVLSQVEFDILVSIWEEECFCMRNGLSGNFSDYSDCRSDTYFFVDEVI